MTGRTKSMKKSKKYEIIKELAVNLLSSVVFIAKNVK
jgi:hypothetical protein